MKRSILAILAMLCASVVMNAQVTDSTASPSQRQGTQGTGTQGTPGSNTYQQGQQGDFSKIKSDELPASVRRSLEGTEYRNWNVSSAYQNSRTGQYRVEMRNGAQTRTYVFDRNGKRIENNQNDKGTNMNPGTGSGTGSGSTGTGGTGTGTGTGTDRDE